MNAIQYFDWGSANNTLLEEFKIKRVHLSFYSPQGTGAFHNDALGKNFYTNTPNISVNYKEASTDSFLENYAKGDNRPAIVIQFEYDIWSFLEKVSTNELYFVKYGDHIYLKFSDRQKQLLLNGDVVTEDVVLRSSKTQKTQRFKITAINR